MRLAVHRPGGERAALRHKKLGDRHVLRAGAGETHGMPGVDDLVFGAMDQSEARIDRQTVVGVAHEEAQHVPVGIVDARRHRPAARDLVAAVDLAAAATGEGQRGGDQRVGRGVPDLVLGLGLVVAQHPVMAREIAEVPGGRRADPGDLRTDVDQDANIEIGATDPRGLHDPEQSGAMQVAFGLVGHAAQLLAFGRAPGQDRRQRARPLHHLFVGNAREGNALVGQCRRDHRGILPQLQARQFGPLPHPEERAQRASRRMRNRRGARAYPSRRGPAGRSSG